MCTSEKVLQLTRKDRELSPWQCGDVINNQTYPDLVYDAPSQAKGEIGNQNCHCCDNSHDFDWTMKWARNGIAHSEGKRDPGFRFDQLEWNDEAR